MFTSEAPPPSILQIRISKPVNSTKSDEESDECDEENPSFIEEGREGSNVPCGVTPFMSGVAAAGNLIAKKRTPGSRGNGLIKVQEHDPAKTPMNSTSKQFLCFQVNGKQYNHARLLLGYMGALHPVNRLAAYVTGRVQLSAPAKSDPRTDTVGVSAVLAAAVGHQTAEQKTNAQTSGKTANHLGLNVR